MYVENPRITFRRNLLRILNEYRQQTGHGTKYVAKCAGMPENMLQEYKNGRRYPGPENLQRIAQALGLPVETFFRLDL